MGRLPGERKVFRQLQSLENAVATLWASWRVTTPSIEQVSLEQSHGRVLAEDVFSAIDVTGFDRAAMDGFAVTAEDTFSTDEQNPVKLKVLGQLEAGDASAYVASRGEAIEIATGAPMRPQYRNGSVKNDSPKLGAR